MHDSLHVLRGDTASRRRGHIMLHMARRGGGREVWNHVLAPEISDVISELVWRRFFLKGIFLFLLYLDGYAIERVRCRTV